jgi:pimeloyl-ACP methyl ester carboxylesterase
MRYAAAVLAFALLAPGARAGEKAFDSDGVKIAYLDEGRGEPVVLLHGFGASAREMWVEMPLAKTQLLPALAKEYRVIAPDLRGHGNSGKPHDPKKYGKEMAEDVVRLLDHLKVKKAHVVGYSMGAAVAGRLLASHPDRVRSVTFGGGGPVFQPPREFTTVVDATAESLERGKGIGPLVVALTPEGEEKPSPEQAAVVSGLYLNGKDQKALAAVMRGYAGLEVTADDLRAAKAPVRFVYGNRDVLKELAVRAGKLLGKSDAVVVEQGDHVSTLVAPEFRKAVGEFLKSHDK